MKPTSVHFVGSIGLNTVDDVFRTCGRTLGRRLKRLPDGEPGGRRLWISWQVPLLRASPYLRPIGDPMALIPLELVPGVNPDDIHFGELGYCREARISYRDFRRARERGDIPAHVRFQVSLPTPLAVIGSFVHADGPEATNRRIATASRHVPEFGIAAERGIARKRTSDKVEELIQLLAACSEEPAQAVSPY